MSGHFWDGVVTILGGIATVAIVALIVSNRSQTPAILQNFFSGYGNALDVAVSPVTGQASRPNLSYAGGGFGALGGSGGFGLTAPMSF